MKEPANNLDEIVPGRLTSAELRAMALRQQQQIDSQHQLLATKEQRLRFLKSQEVRSAVANAEGERLRRLRERVEAQESKLRRLRALRGQVDLQKTYNVTLSNDLDSIRALFSEKEKELSLAVAKVEALTRQLEDLRRDRRGPIGLLSTGSGAGQQNLPPQASRELEKLRRELMYRNQLSLQQDARLHLQREALQQRQAELRSVDQRIYELQTRLQRKKAANVQNGTQNQQLHVSHQQQPQKHHPQQQQQQSALLSTNQQHLQQQQQQTNLQLPFSNDNTTGFNTNLVKHGGVAALKQQLLAKQANHVAPAPQQQHPNNNTNININSFTHNKVNRDINRNISRSNIAAVEPYIHTPQKSAISNANTNYIGNAANALKHAATANTNLQNQLIQDLSHVKLNQTHNNSSPVTNQNPNFFGAESDESKLAKKMLTTTLKTKSNSGEASTKQQPENINLNSATHIYAEVGPKKRDLIKEVAANLEAQSNSPSTTTNSTTTISNQPTSKIPKSILSNASASALINKLNSNASSAPHTTQLQTRDKSHDSDKMPEVPVMSETLSEKNKQQLTVHSMPLGTANKAVATAVTTITTTNTTGSGTGSERMLQKPKPMQQPTSNASNIAVPPRKPISSVAPTSVTSSIPKMISYSPKVNRVAPSIVSSVSHTSSTTTISSATTTATVSTQEARPALPPKPSKMSPSESNNESSSSNSSPNSGTTNSQSVARRLSPDINAGLQNININDNLPIKAKPLTIRKQPLSEQPRLKLTTSSLKSSLSATNRKIDVPATSSLLYNDASRTASTVNSDQVHSTADEDFLTSAQQQQSQSQQQQHSPSIISQSSSNVDEPDRIDSSHSSSELSGSDINKQRQRNNSAPGISSNGKPKLARRVSFDPLALLLDASLEGELELVKKTAMQVANPSAANDEGITALHNAICAGHFDIVKFLVEFGCDVNAQDSDGWTPLHCAASCNNLAMVKFLVESGACLFAATLSDHETPAEKCEEDEEGFDGCSEYLYSIQEKLGILNNGKVYAVFSYEAQNSDELTFNVNDRLIILRKGDDSENEWWWAKTGNDEEGYVPRNLLGLYPRVPPQMTNFNE